ncbi:(deoxy)nucleoside triphosphate pyrophosphohydrolase [Pedobacter sp. PWIIR3]
MIHVTCAIIVNTEGEVLVAQRSAEMSMPLKIEFPGGKIEPGENPQQSLKREILEELNIEIRIQSEMPAHIHSYPNLDINLIPFVCEIIDDTIQLKEHAAYQWLKPKDLLDLDWAEADIPVCKNYLSAIGVL